jgi:hypothetical protein
MALTLSNPLRMAALDSGIATQFDTTGVLEIRSGTRPGAAGTAPAGTLLASITLPADAFAAAASPGTITKNGTWQDTSADATGTASWFRMKLSADAGTTNTTDKRMDGDITLTGGGGDMTIDNTSIAAAQSVTVNTFVLTQPG